jgi:hypothetical protein
MDDTNDTNDTGTGLDVLARREDRQRSNQPSSARGSATVKPARRLCTPLVLSMLLQSGRFPCPHTFLLLTRHRFLEGDLGLLLL